MKPIHPFPARMAPDIVRDVVAHLRPGQKVIDPMCGSGTVLREGVNAGLQCVGYDIDPLAVLMARSWTTPVAPHRLLHDAHIIAERARAIPDGLAQVPWRDEETDEFARYWFGQEQLIGLAKLAEVLRHTRLRTRDVLRLCLSRLVITKDSGASLARDVSHSRPHRVRDSTDFDVLGNFLRSARQVAHSIESDCITGSARVQLGDARELADPPNYFDVAVTSPPYLNAIDYLRGHRLALIWLGFDVPSLRQARSDQIGAERSLESAPFDVTPFVRKGGGSEPSERHVGWLRRYASDMTQVLSSLRRVVRSDGKVIIVVGNSVIRGSEFDNAGVIIQCAHRLSYDVVERRERDIPPTRRYLPPPGVESALGQRMRSESVLTFARSA
jgi:DNA modification methylase